MYTYCYLKCVEIAYKKKKSIRKLCSWKIRFSGKAKGGKKKPSWIIVGKHWKQWGPSANSYWVAQSYNSQANKQVKKMIKQVTVMKLGCNDTRFSWSERLETWKGLLSIMFLSFETNAAAAVLFLGNVGKKGKELVHKGRKQLLTYSGAFLNYYMNKEKQNYGRNIDFLF